MGADGPGIFDDDVACDVRDEYEDLLHEQVDDGEATRRVIELFVSNLGDDEAHLLWLGLAAAQSLRGRLDPEVRDRALALIDAGAGLQAWQEAGPLAVTARRAALQQLRTQLTGPQPPRKVFSRRWKHRMDLQAGDLLAHDRHGWVSLWLVTAVVGDDRENHPVLQRLVWPGVRVPAPGELPPLIARARFPVPQDHVVPVELLRHHPRDPDWTGAGFTRPARDIAPRPRNHTLTGGAWMTQWAALGDALRSPNSHTGPRPHLVEQIGFLITTWDPLGIKSPALIDSEYEPLVAHLARHLTPTSSPAGITDLLRDEILGHYGLTTTDDGIDQLAEDIAAAARHT